MKKEEAAIKEIIKKFGDTIDLKKSPFVIAEIVREFSDVLGKGTKSAACAPPGGPPKRGDQVVDPEFLKVEINKLSNSIKLLHKKVDAINK